MLSLTSLDKGVPVTRTLARTILFLMLATVIATGLDPCMAYAAGNVDCDKVMSAAQAGKKNDEIAADLKIPTSSVVQCRSQAHQGASRGGQLVCPPKWSQCIGPNGQACYKPSAGETCTQGLVCQPTYSACIGPHGHSCYKPSAGEKCTP